MAKPNALIIWPCPFTKVHFLTMSSTLKQCFDRSSLLKITILLEPYNASVSGLV